MTTAELVDLIIKNVLTGGGRTTAVKVREVLFEILGSYNNNEDGAIKASKINNGLVVDQNNIYIRSNGLSDSPGARFFKLEFDDYGNLTVPLPMYTSINHPDGTGDATNLITDLQL